MMMMMMMMMKNDDFDDIYKEDVIDDDDHIPHDGEDVPHMGGGCRVLYKQAKLYDGKARWVDTYLNPSPCDQLSRYDDDDHDGDNDHDDDDDHDDHDNPCLDHSSIPNDDDEDNLRRT